MSKVEKHSAVLAVFNSHAVTPARRDKLIEQAKLQLDTLVSHRRQAPYRAVAMGMLLHQLKAGCKHGEWMPVYGQILKSSKFVTESTAQTYCSQWMRLATEFLVETQTAKPEFIALAGSELSLDTKNAVELAFVAKMEAFVEGRSLDELLTDLGLRNAGAKKKRKLAKGDSGKDADEPEAAHAVTVQDRFNEIDDLLRRARKAAADKAIWMSFSKQQHADLKAAANQTSETITDLYVKTHGRSAR